MFYYRFDLVCIDRSLKFIQSFIGLLMIGRVSVSIEKALRSAVDLIGILFFHSATDIRLIVHRLCICSENDFGFRSSGVFFVFEFYCPFFFVVLQSTDRSFLIFRLFRCPSIFFGFIVAFRMFYYFFVVD